MCNSDSFLDVNDQLPTTSLVGPGFERIGWEVVVIFTAVLALCSLSRNSPRFSGWLQRSVTQTLAQNYVKCLNANPE